MDYILKDCTVQSCFKSTYYTFTVDSHSRGCLGFLWKWKRINSIWDAKWCCWTHSSLSWFSTLYSKEPAGLAQSFWKIELLLRLPNCDQTKCQLGPVFDTSCPGWFANTSAWCVNATEMGRKQERLICHEQYREAPNATYYGSAKHMPTVLTKRLVYSKPFLSLYNP